METTETGRSLGPTSGLHDLLQDPCVAGAALLGLAEAQGILTVDDRGLITGWSAGAARLFGFSGGEILGQPLDALRRSEAGEEVWRGRSGEVLEVEVSSALMFTESGARLGDVLLVQTLPASCKRRLGEAQAARALIESVWCATVDLIYVFDREGRYLYASGPGAQAVGLEVADMVGRHWRELGFPPAVMERLDAQRRQVEETREPLVAETIFPTVLGARDYEYHITPVLEGDQVVGTVATVHDITERKRAEHALRESEARLARVITHAPFPIMIHAEDGEILELNDAWLRMTGYSGSELPTFSAWAKLAHGDRAAEVEGAVHRVFDAPEAVSTDLGELEITVRDGTARFWRFSSTLLGRGRDARRTALIMAVDLSERRQVEEALRRSERRLRGIFEAAPIGISLADLEGRLSNTNPALQAMLGYSGEELSAARYPAITHPEDTPESVRLFEALVRGERSGFQIEKRYVRKDESVFWARLTTSLIRDGEGRPLFVVGMVEDISERRATEVALRESEERFRTTFERAGVGMVIADAEGRFVTTNPRFQRFLGYEAEELEGMRFTEITWPEDADLDWSLFEELRQGWRDSYEIEKRYVRKDGKVVWGRLIGTSVRNGRTSYIGMVEEITTRKEAEEAQARLVELLEATPDGVGIIDAQGYSVFLNRAGRRMLGIAEDADITGHMVSRYHPAWAASIILREALPTAAQEGVWQGETALRSSDGREIPVSQVVLAHRRGQERVQYYSTIFRDQTARFRTEQAQRFLLDASSALSTSLELERTIESIAGLVVPDRADYCFLDLLEDGVARRAMAVHRDPALATLMQALRESPDPARAQLGVGQVLRSGEPLLVKQVTEPWLEATSSSPEHGRLLRTLAPCSEMTVALRARGEVIGALTFGSTTPDRHFEEDDLRIAEDLCSRASLALDNAWLYRDARRATAARDDLLRIVAHDLRNPLDTISLSAQALRRSSTGEQRAADRQLEMIARAVDRALHLVNDLLDVGKMEAGTLTVIASPQDPVALIDDAVSAHRGLAEHRRLELEVKLPEERLPLVLADRARVLQIFSNLIGNALKFTPDGGRITLRAVPQDGFLAFEVEDTGPGVAPEDLPFLFQPFWQAESSGRSGAGLGLPIVKGLVGAHGGTIGVESDPGQGTRVRFTLPVVPASGGR